MDVCRFLEQLNRLFPSQEDENTFKLRVEQYSKLFKETETKANRELDYDKMLNLMVENYPYRAFPNYTEISKYLEYVPVKNENQAEKNWDYKSYIVTTEDGYEYEFVTVPPSWDCGHKLSEFPKYREKVVEASDNCLEEYRKWKKYHSITKSLPG